MKFIFLLFFLSSLCPIILNLESCAISYTNGKGISSYNDCKAYSTTSDNKVCCYVKGQDKDKKDISACTELTGTEKGALKDLFELEGSIIRKYYLEADCNLGKTLKLCDPDDQRSLSPLSTDICKQYPYVSYTGIIEDTKCCYVTGKNVKNEDVYSCVGIDKYFYTEKEMANQIESGKFERLGALKDVKIYCASSSLFSFLTLLITLFVLIL
jgi:hypothetical protein